MMVPSERYLEALIHANRTSNYLNKMMRLNMKKDIRQLVKPYSKLLFIICINCLNKVVIYITSYSFLIL